MYDAFPSRTVCPAIPSATSVKTATACCGWQEQEVWPVMTATASSVSISSVALPLSASHAISVNSTSRPLTISSGCPPLPITSSASTCSAVDSSTTQDAATRTGPIANSSLHPTEYGSSVTPMVYAMSQKTMTDMSQQISLPTTTVFLATR